MTGTNPLEAKLIAAGLLEGGEISNPDPIRAIAAKALGVGVGCTHEEVAKAVDRIIPLVNALIDDAVAEAVEKQREGIEAAMGYLNGAKDDSTDEWELLASGAMMELTALIRSPQPQEPADAE